MIKLFISILMFIFIITCTRADIPAFVLLMLGIFCLSIGIVNYNNQLKES